MKYDIQRDPQQDPSLVTMTEAAIRLLSRNPLGFYLFVEGEGQPCIPEQRREERVKVKGHLSSTWPSYRRPHRPWPPCRHSLPGAH